MKKIIIISFLFISQHFFSQEIKGEELLEKAIQFHDPDNNWQSFNGVFNVTMNYLNGSERKSKININLPNQYFSVFAFKDSIETKYIVDKSKCSFSLNGNENPSLELKAKYNLNCERAKLFKNYYTYLYGLPMKLKDKGTIIDKDVERRRFKGKEYLVLKVTYPKEIGKDTWYFYFNPISYALEVYQFFKETKDSGEYILLSDLETINNIKMPKTRAWYYNKDDKYLGTDILSLSN